MVGLLAAMMAVGCTSAYFSAASGSAYDDLYVSHDRTVIAERQRAEAEARKAEAEARRAEALALQAEYEAQLAQLNVQLAQNGNNQVIMTKSQAAGDGIIIIDDDQPVVNGYQSFVADSYESAYARRLQGFKSASYRMPSSYFNLRYGGSYSYATAYDPAFYNIMVSGDQVWVEPRYITSMFGTWGATNATALLYSPWYYGWSSWNRYDPWFYSWYGYPRYSWYDWNWNICYGGGWGINLWWGWGGHYHPWRPYHYYHHHHHIGHGHIGGPGFLGGGPTHGHWGKTPIAQLYFEGVMQGSGGTDGILYYRPDDSMTRQEFVVSMIRAGGVDTKTYKDTELPFEDTDSVADWAEDAMKAAYALGWFTGSGKGDKLYAQPTATITREAAMTMLARSISAESDSDALNGFGDSGRVSDWARPGLTAMVEKGIINGIDGKLQPQGNVTRAQVAAMLYRMG